MRESIPAGWQRSTFGAVLGRRLETAKGNEELLSVVSHHGVVPQGLTGRRNISSADKSAYLKVYKGDIVYNTMRMWQGVSGRSAYHGIVSPAYTVCALNDGVDGDFMAKVIRHPFYVAQFRRLAQGLTSDVWNLRYSKFATIPFLLPPHREQRRIAEILDAADANIRVVRLKLGKRRMLADAAAHFAMSSLDEYEYSTVSDLFSIESGLTLGPHRETLQLKHPYLRVANVQRNRIELGDISSVGVQPAESSRYALTTGDLLVVEGHADPDEIGRCAQVPDEAAGLLYQNHLFRLRSKSVSPDFGLAYLNSEAARRYWRTNSATSSGLYTINSRLLAQMPFPMVSPERQAAVRELLHSSGEAVAAAAEELGKLRLLRKGLMDDLLTGKVRVGKAWR